MPLCSRKGLGVFRVRHVPRAAYPCPFARDRARSVPAIPCATGSLPARAPWHVHVLGRPNRTRTPILVNRHERLPAEQWESRMDQPGRAGQRIVSVAQLRTVSVGVLAVEL